MDGVEAMLKIRAEGMNMSTPIAALTANSMDTDFEEYIGKGMDAAVGKPVNFDQLFKLISRLKGKTHEELSSSVHVRTPKNSNDNQRQ